MTTDAVGGVWSYALDLAAGLAGAVWRSTLAVLGPAPSGRRPRTAAAAGCACVRPGCRSNGLAKPATR